MALRLTLLVSALLAGLGFHSHAGAEGQAVTLAVDATAAGGPLERVWAYHGYDEVNYTTTPEGEELLRTLAAAHTAPVYVRTHFLFNTGDGTPTLKWGSTNLYTEDASGKPIYDYTLIDRIMDTTIDAGTLPLVEIGFMPEALSTQPSPYESSGPYVLDSGSFYPPRDYEAWGALVSEWVRHVKDRYPAAAAWQWELWNEPDIPYWHGTFEEYARLFDYTEAALHAVLPEASLGGPAVASPERAFLTQFLEHCAAGTNAVTGRTGTRLDMVSFHAKGGVSTANGHVRMDLGNQLRLHRAGFDTIAKSAAYARTPVVISEADPDGCAACPASQRRENAYRNSPAYGAYEVAMMKRSLDLAAEMGVDLRGVLSWAFTFPGSAYFAGYRALSTNGIHLPVLNAFKLLGSLSGTRLGVESSGARPLAELLQNGVRAEPDVDALAAIDGDRVQILVWNYHDDLTPAEPAAVSLQVALPAAFAAGALLTHTRVDESHGDSFSVWTSQGSPAAPSAEQVAALREAMEPVVLERDRVVSVANGAVNVSFELPRFGISLVTLVPPKDGDSAPPRTSDAGCSCRFRAPPPSRPAALIALAAGMAILRRRSSARKGAFGSTGHVRMTGRSRSPD